MRISDWSSDVCSSDLRSRVSVLTRRRVALGTALAVLLGALAWVGYAVWLRPTEFERASSLLPASTLRVTWTDWAGLRDELRSEEHTSELQSLMRNSYAVFCLKKKN